MTTNILIVDSDEAFATILKEGLEADKTYKATIATSGEEALEAIVEQPFDMTIVDMGLSDIEGTTLVRAIREAKPAMRVMLIPLFGEELDPEAESLDIQGVLTKPFFMGDLPQKIKDAFSRPVRVGLTLPPSPAVVREAAPPPPSPVWMEEAIASPPIPRPVEEVVISPPGEAQPEEVAVVPPPKPPQKAVAVPLSERLNQRSEEITKHLTNLAFDLNAEVVLLSQAAELVAHAGSLDEDRSRKLAVLVTDSFTAAARAAEFLGESNGRFELSQNEGDDYSLYSRSVTEELVLSVALRADTPPGTVRYITKQTADKLSKLVREVSE